MPASRRRASVLLGWVGAHGAARPALVLLLLAAAGPALVDVTVAQVGPLTVRFPIPAPCLTATVAGVTAGALTTTAYHPVVVRSRRFARGRACWFLTLCALVAAVAALPLVRGFPAGPPVRNALLSLAIATIMCTLGWSVLAWAPATFLLTIGVLIGQEPWGFNALGILIDPETGPGQWIVVGALTALAGAGYTAWGATPRPVTR